MSDGKGLTKDIVELFLADEESVDLSKITAIDDEAVESLRLPFDPRLTELHVPERSRLTVVPRATRVLQPEAFSGKPFAVQRPYQSLPYCSQNPQARAGGI